MYGLCKLEGAEFQNITVETTGNLLLLLVVTVRGLVWKTPPHRGDLLSNFVVELFALGSGPLRSNKLSIYLLNYSNKMQTSSKVTFTLQRLLFFYHSIPLSNICHQANPGRGILLLLNCCILKWWPAHLHETADICCRSYLQYFIMSITDIQLIKNLSARTCKMELSYIAQ